MLASIHPFLDSSPLENDRASSPVVVRLIVAVLASALSLVIGAWPGSLARAQDRDGAPDATLDATGEADVEVASDQSASADPDAGGVSALGADAALDAPPPTVDAGSSSLAPVPAAPSAAQVPATALPPVPLLDDELSARPPILARPLVERPLTLPQLVFRLGARTLVTGVRDTFGSGYTTYATVVGDASVGLLDDFEIGVVYAPVQLAPEPHYLGPSVAFVGRFLSGVVDMGASLTLHAPVEDDGGSVSGTFGLPVLVHAAPWLRLDFVPQLGARADNRPVLSASLPLTATFQIVPAVFAGTTLGFDFIGIEGFDDAFFAASAFFGGTISRAYGPTADLSVTFTLPSVTDGTQSFSVLLAASFYIYAR